MFGNLFFIIIALISIVSGIRNGDFIWALSGVIMLTGVVGIIYCLKTGKLSGKTERSL